MNAATAARIVKDIKADIDKCTGCRACEMACSAFHAMPRYSSVNPAKSRIRVVVDELTDEYVPIRAGNFTRTGCDGRHVYLIDGKEYSECSFCRASCPTRDFFIEPDSGFPLKCDMCESVPPLAEPMCVQVCEPGCLTYEERKIDRIGEGQLQTGEIEAGLQSLISQYGIDAVIESLNRTPKA
ncbi:MAG: (4Fe-4S)-binding protein [Burkholderiales bacterium]|nr:(4Fe-4S)-binding protein [Burkholderiales bacterium]